MAATLPQPCGQCGKTVKPGDEFVIGHIIPRWQRPDLTWVPSNWRVEHRACSDATGKRHADQSLKTKALESVGVFSRDQDPRNHRPLPFSLPEVRAGLLWADHDLRAHPWLVGLVDVPADAAAPLYMTPVPADAVGSYAMTTPEREGAIDWIERTQGITLRWWQRLGEESAAYVPVGSRIRTLLVGAERASAAQIAALTASARADETTLAPSAEGIVRIAST